MIRIAGCGDILIAGRLPQGKYPGFGDICKFLHSHDIRFGNLETTIHNNEGYPSLFPGGVYAMARPNVLEDIKAFGFNLLNIGNNHTLDYSHKGLEASLRYLRKSGLVFGGAGMNLAEASLPAYIETQRGRVALIAATSSFHDSDAAGHQSINVHGRPGVNPLRHTEVLQITPDLMEAVRRIAVSTGVNDYRNLGARNGYVLHNENIRLRDLEFVQGDEVSKISHPLPKDVKRIVHAIREAKRQSDCIVVSLHGHQLKGTDNNPDDFIVEFCHEAVQAGANIVFCHGAHVIRGIEVFGKGIIFYGLGDFIMKNEIQEFLPADFYEKYNVSYEDYGMVGTSMDIMTKNRHIGMCANPKVWESFIPSIEFDEESQKVLSVRLYPITLHFELPRSRRGWPELYEENHVICELQQLSAEFGTKVIAEKNVGVVML